MAYEEYSRKIFCSECACGKGFSRYFRRYVYNDWGHKLVYDTPIETVCDYCKSRYHYEEEGNSTYLVPNGLSIPRNPPTHLDKFTLDIKEETVSKHSKPELDIMLADMTAPKRRYIKNLENRDAIRFAEDIWQNSGRKALAPIIECLREIIEEYDEIYVRCEQKKKIKAKYHQEATEYAEKLHAVISQSKKLSFSLCSTQHSKKHEEALEFGDRYIAEHTKEDINDLEMDLTFEKDFTNLFWDSYHIIECTEPQYISLKPSSWFPSKNKLTKKYLCICSLCGKKEEYAASDFRIKQKCDQTYEVVPCCTCHKVTSFEAKAMDILNRHGISYIREKTFDDLVGDTGRKLRFDFALFKNCTVEGLPIIDLIIELQGPHHEEKGYYDEDGDYITDDLSLKEQWYAERRLERQLRYDHLKQEFCSARHIKLECIKCTTSDYARLEKKLMGILKANNYDCLPEIPNRKQMMYFD